MTGTGHYAMTDQQQIGSLALCALLVTLIAYGIWLIVQNIAKDDEDRHSAAQVDAYSDDYLLGRDPHAVDVRTSMREARTR